MPYKLNDSHAQQIHVAEMQVELEKEREKYTGSRFSDEAIHRHEIERAENEGMCGKTIHDAEEHQRAQEAEFALIQKSEMSEERDLEKMTQEVIDAGYAKTMTDTRMRLAELPAPSMSDGELDAEFARLHKREMERDQEKAKPEARAPRISKEMPRASQFVKSGRVIATTLNDQMALNEPQARMELLKQSTEFLIRRMIDVGQWARLEELLQMIGVALMQRDAQDADGTLDPKRARCSLCKKLVAGDSAAVVDRPMVVLA